MNIPILYSFRRCPYAMRARMAIAYSQITVELREVDLKHKPQELLDISPKATVPVLQLDHEILEESLDIMFWAITKNDPENIHLSQCNHYLQNPLIAENDDMFKTQLDRYKYADRYPEHDEIIYRQQGEVFLTKLNHILTNHNFLMGDKLSIVDYAIFPFIRQFAHVDITWFNQSQYEHLRNWLKYFLNSDLFLTVMHKYKPWKAGDEISVFP